MFSFRRDKVGFFITLILLAIAVGTAISTLVLLIIGMAEGDWKEYLLSVKWILGSAWVACILTVLVRLRIFQWQQARQASRKPTENMTASEQEADASRSPE